MALPAFAQPRREVLQPHDLDLGPREPGTGVMVKDLEDDLRAIEYLAVGLLLQMVCLRRRELVLDEQRVALELAHEPRELPALALAEIRSRVIARPSLRHPG